MFQEVERFVRDLRTTIYAVHRNAVSAAQFFHALALVDSYNYMMQLADERTSSHPEVQRVPELRTILLQHFYENADRHISLRGNRIFSATLLGGPRSLRDWQEAGYSTRRTTSNYPQRLKYWQAIYDDAPLQYQQRVSSDNLFGTAGSVYQSTFLSPKGKFKKPSRPELREGKVVFADVDYTDVIERRNRRYAGTRSIVPWWMPLNYGTTGGYPSVPGLHFIEDAEQSVPQRIDEYVRLLDLFLADIFDRELTTDDISNVELWARGRVRPGVEYVPTFDVARIITFGVPF